MGKNNSAFERKAIFDADFPEDLRTRIELDRKVAMKIVDLVKAVLRDPFTGIGKPEPLKYLGSDIWSRRITQEHRLVYLVAKDRVNFLQCRYHY